MAWLGYCFLATLILSQKLHAVSNILFGFDITTQISLNVNASSTYMVVVTAYNMGHVYQCGVNVRHDQSHYECNSSDIKTIHCSDNTNLFKFIEIDTKQLLQQEILITKIFLNNTIVSHFCFDGRCSNTLSVLKNSLISIKSNGDYNDAASRTLCKEDAQLRFGFHQSYNDWVFSYPKFVVINLHWGFYQHKCFADIEAKPNQTYACNISHHATFNKEDLNKFEFSMQLDNAEDDGIILDKIFVAKDSNMIIFDSFCGEIFDYKCINEYEINAKHFPHIFFSLFNITNSNKLQIEPQQYEPIFTIPQESKYVIVAEKMTWREAYDYCNAYYDGLAMPKTRNDLIALILLKNELYFEEDVWLGLTNMEYNGSAWNVVKNGTWIFINNQSVNINGTRYILWAPNEPNNDENEHCAGIHFDSSKQNYINDFSCNLEAIFACSRKLVIPSSPELYTSKIGGTLPDNHGDAKSGNVISMSLLYNNTLTKCNFYGWQPYECNLNDWGVHHCMNNTYRSNNNLFEIYIDNSGADTVYFDTVYFQMNEQLYMMEYFCYENENDETCQDILAVGSDYNSHILLTMNINKNFANIGYITIRSEDVKCVTGAKQYEVVTELFSFDEAQNYPLATIGNDADFNQIIDVWHKFGGYKNMWIGLKTDDGANWTWIDETKCTNTEQPELCTIYWAENQPSSTVQEFCGGIYSVKNGMFNNFDCTDRFYIICNKDELDEHIKSVGYSDKISVWFTLTIIVMVIVIVLFIAMFLYYRYCRSKRLANSPQYRRTNTVSGVHGEEQGTTCEIPLTYAEMEQTRQAMDFPLKILSFAMLAKSRGLSENSANTLSLPSVPTASHNDTSQENETITKDLQELEILPSHENA